MIVGPDQGDIKTARDFAVRSGSDCWFPYYPLCTDHCITETYEMVLQCYREMQSATGRSTSRWWAFPPAAHWLSGFRFTSMR